MQTMAGPPAGSRAGGGFPVRLQLSDPNGSNGFAIAGKAAADRSGRSLCGGDINGDGVDDLIVGAHPKTVIQQQDCGPLDPPQAKHTPVTVFIANQFQSGKVTSKQAVELRIPSTKNTPAS